MLEDGREIGSEGSSTSLAAPSTTPAVIVVATILGNSGSPPTHSLSDFSLHSISTPGGVGILDALWPNAMHYMADREYRLVLRGRQLSGGTATARVR